MNDYHKMAKVILVALALYIIVWAGFSFVCVVPAILDNRGFEGSVDVPTLLAGMFAIAYAIGLLWLIRSAGDRIVDKIAGQSQHTAADLDWLAFAFRLAAVCFGVYLLYHLLAGMIISLARVLLSGRSRLPTSLQTISRYQWLQWIFTAAVSIYLLCGAPHFVRWQVKKTLQQCSRAKPQDQPASDNNET